MGAAPGKLRESHDCRVDGFGLRSDSGGVVDGCCCVGGHHRIDDLSHT
jgi:hypothetical protein